MSLFEICPLSRKHFWFQRVFGEEVMEHLRWALGSLDLVHLVLEYTPDQRAIDAREELHRVFRPESKFMLTMFRYVRYEVDLEYPRWRYRFMHKQTLGLWFISMSNRTNNKHRKKRYRVLGTMILQNAAQHVSFDTQHIYCEGNNFQIVQFHENVVINYDDVMISMWQLPFTQHRTVQH